MIICFLIFELFGNWIRFLFRNLNKISKKLSTEFLQKKRIRSHKYIYGYLRTVDRYNVETDPFIFYSPPQGTKGRELG
ncbi:hypothetical protein CWS01_13465 [Niallia nealsonii]|uniref:Uncharacterized protein n=1 Tax=Niallia nealsonii TaxID=115979 RepID=A0A2N0Z0P9_9BACI|nr:hypothetical protein CWS01_13465 [Niallia nealsonii]